jgi:serine/threonine-protein kinase
MLARPAAIKLIRPEALGGRLEKQQQAVNRFEREARATAALQSVHTIDIYDFGITDRGAFYYVMELLDGMDMEVFIKRFGPLPASRTIDLLRQACHSLQEAHAQGLIHRDIKPANLYICRLGPDYDFVKVLDFGLVISSPGSMEEMTRLTQAGAACGTPDYMPPEAALGKKVDARADIYALGCVGYWLLTGCPVFEGDSPVAVLLDHVRTEPVPPSHRTEIEVPEDLEEVILTCLAKDAAARPQSAGELADKLAACNAATDWDADQASQWWNLHLPSPS